METMMRGAIVLVAVVALGCNGAGRDATSDSAFAGVQARGHDAMGVDQYTSAHRFEPLPDGGRIELQRDTADRSEERRVGKECRSGWAADQEKKKRGDGV